MGFGVNLASFGVPLDNTGPSGVGVFQPLDSDLTAIAGLSPSNDDIIQRKAGAWTNRTMAQLGADLTHNNLAGLTTGDPHTQYALLAGRSGGQTLAGSPTTAQNLTLRANTADYTTGLIYAENHINIDPGTRSFSSSPDPSVGLTGTYTMTTGTSKGGGFRDASTIIFQGTSTTFSASLFNTVTVVKNDSSMVIGLAPFVGFIANHNIQADSQDITQFKQNSFVERGLFSTTGSGTPIIRGTQWDRFNTDAPITGNVQSGAIVYTASAARFDQAVTAGTGIVYKNYGVNLTGYTTGRDDNRAIRSTTGVWELADDIYQMNEDKGLTLIDRTTGIRRRLYVNSGTLSTEEVDFWLPDELQSGLFAYYRADQANVGGVADGADITIVHDKSGNGRDLAQGGGTDVPIWENDTGAFSNNKPAINFTAANSQSLEHTRDASILIALTGPYTVWAMVSFKTVAAAMRVFTHQTAAGRGVGITATPAWELRWGSGAASTAGTPAANTMYLIRIYATVTTQELFVNEVSVTSGAASQNLAQIVLGAHRSNVPAYSSFLNGYIYEAGIYSLGDVTASSVWQRYIDNGINTRYGTAI